MIEKIRISDKMIENQINNLVNFYIYLSLKTKMDS